MKRKSISPQSVCADKLKILADPTRLAIIEILMDGPQHVGEMNAVLCVDQSLLSHHLKALREADLVKSRRDGKGVLYSLTPAVEVARSGKAINLSCCRLSFN